VPECGDKPWKHLAHLTGRNETELLAAHAAGAALACVRAGVVYGPVDGRVYAPAWLDAYLRGIAAAQIRAAKKHWVPPESFFDGPIDTSGI
jgi:hypothetical protein